MPILYRYIIRETLAVFLATNLILLTILLSFRLSSLLAAAAGNMALSAVWMLIGLQAVRFLVILMPLAFVLAAVMTLGRLYRDHEISAALACGITPRHQTRALLTCAVPVVLLLLALSMSILPRVYRSQDTLRQQAQQEAGMILFTPNTFRRLDDGTVVHTGAIEGGQLRDFLIARDEPDGGHSLILADYGEMQGDEQQRHLLLHHGRRLAWNANHDPAHTTLFTYQNADLRLPGANTLAANDNRLRNLATSELGTSPEHLSEWQSRSNPAIALLIYALALPLLARSQPRQGRYQKIVPAFIAFALYINLLDLITIAIRKQQIPPLPGSYWLHGAVLALILWRQTRSRA